MTMYSLEDMNKLKISLERKTSIDKKESTFETQSVPNHCSTRSKGSSDMTIFDEIQTFLLNPESFLN